MKSVAKIFLIFLFIPLFLTGILLSNLRFQILNTNFWLTTFEQNNVYNNLAVSLKKASVSKIEGGGGDAKDASVLTDLINSDNIKDVFSKNITNVLNFINGKTQSFDVYIPIDKIPNELLPASIGSKPDTIPVSYLLRTFNISGITESDIMLISNIGLLVNIILAVDVIFVVTILFLIFLITDKGKRLWGMGVPLLLSGVIALGGYAFGQAVKQSMIQEWPKSSEPFQLIFGTFTPFILEKIINVWLSIGVVSVLLGILLFFLKRPVYNIKK